MSLAEPNFKATGESVKAKGGDGVSYTVEADTGGKHLDLITLILNSSHQRTSFWDKHVARSGEDPKEAYLMRNTANDEFEMDTELWSEMI